MAATFTNQISIDRPHYEQQQFNEELEYAKPKHSFGQKLKSSIGDCNLKHQIVATFPIIKWLGRYKSENLVGDIISGITVAIMQIPQGMGFALLANVPPINGIYTAFFPVLIYAIFGTSMHNSMGTFSIVNIMLSKSVLDWSDFDQNPMVNGTTTGDVQLDYLDGHKYTPTQVSVAVTFLVAIVFLIMSILRLGILSSLLSEALVSGLATGAAIHVFTSQVSHLFGIKLPRIGQTFQIFLTYFEIGKQLSLGQFNWTAILISTISIIILFVCSTWINPALAKKCPIPIPIEFFMILFGTLASKYLLLESAYDVKSVGEIPVGFPEFELPPFDLMPHVIGDAIAIAMVSYIISVSLALVYSQQFNYEIDFNQELLAMGASNVIGSMFSCMPLSASLSRTSVQVAVGGKTQLASIISCCLLISVLLWIGPFFEPLPKCVIASVIIVALKGVLMKVTEFRKFWKLSHLDGAVWMITFLSVVIIAIDIGLGIGVCLSLFVIFVREMQPYTCLLGNVPTTNLYVDISRYKKAIELDSIKIFHYSGGLNFVSRTYFRQKLCSTVGIDLDTEIRLKPKKNADELTSSHNLKTVIVDFSALSYIDPSAVTGLKILSSDFRKVSINFFIAATTCEAFDVMTKCGLHKMDSDMFKIFPTVHDAVHCATNMDNVINLGKF